MIIIADEVAVGVEICEDLWMPVPPSSELAMLGANIIVNLSASNELIGKHAYRKQLVAQQSARCVCGYVYASSGFGESTTDLVFSGSALIAENGVILAESKRFSLDEQLIISDIDVEYLYHDRLVSTAFSEGSLSKDTDRGFELEFILPEYRKEAANKLSRTVDPHPSRPKDWLCANAAKKYSRCRRPDWRNESYIRMPKRLLSAFPAASILLWLFWSLS